MTRLSRRQFLAGTAAGATALAAGWSPSARAQDVIALRVSSSMPADANAAHYAWFQAFDAAIKETLADRIRLDYFPTSQLGNEADVAQQVKVGSVDLMLSGSSIWATQVPEIGMLDLGYMFDGFEHAKKALDSGAGEALSKIVTEQTGVTMLGWGFSFGARNVYTKKPVASLADLAQVKLRVLPAPAFIQTFELMGAIPTPIAINELYTALQTGVVDGFEHDAGTVLAQKFYEVTQHGFLTEHLFGPIVAAMGKNGLAKITDDIRPAFLEAAAKATAAQREAAISAAGAAIETLKGLGVTYAPMPAEERAKIQGEVSAALYVPFQDKYPASKAVFETIVAARG
jgi:tripartite ATP-independent transporter DctP family solute receptor